MLSGRRLDLLDPSPLDVEIEDIAHGLARVARWNGQTAGDWPMSVAEHSLLVEDIFARQSRAEPSPAERLAALLHDAPEYVIGDMISPFKAALGLDYAAFEARLAAAVNLRFGLPAALAAPLKARIKKADRASAYLEAVQLAGFTVAEAAKFFGEPAFEGWRGLRLAPRPPAAAAAAFRDRCAELVGQAAR
jgi:5'-deoxynucleotidase YfbR-like HD superfamily hydrolase